MNGRLILSIVLFLPLFAVFLFWSVLSSIFQCGLLAFAILSGLLALTLLSMSISGASYQGQEAALLPSRTLAHTSSVLFAEPAVPSVPRSAAQAYRALDPEIFEYFAAAVIIGEGHGHCFVERCGGANDRGVDVRLKNQFGLPVVVQCKHYAPGNLIGPDMLRDFVGTIKLQGAIYGYFVTTSALSTAAQQVVNHPESHIHLIDGYKLDVLLQIRNREIALAFLEIAASVTGKKLIR